MVRRADQPQAGTGGNKPPPAQTTLQVTIPDADGTSLGVARQASPPEPGGREKTDGSGSPGSSKRSGRSDRSDRSDRFRALVQKASDMVLVVAADGRITYASPSCERILGYQQGAMVGDVFMLTHPDDLATILQCFTRIADPGASTRSEHRVVTHDGQERHVETVFTNLLHEPSVGGFVLNSRDVTERREAEDELRLSQQQLAAAQRLSSTGSWDRNLTTGSTRWSDELYRILGVEAKAEVEPSDEALCEAIHPGDRKTADDIWAKALQNGREDGEFRILRSDGGTRTLQAVVEVAHDEAGSPVHLTGAVQDVTDRRNLERELKRQAFHDSLTGLPNRVLLADRVEHAVMRGQRTGDHFAVMFIDLDDFKTVNDSLGHSAGDQLLVTMGQRLQAIVRPSDTVARLGGDEFAVLLEGAGQEAAEVAATRILAEFEKPVAVADTEAFVRACVGIAVADGPVSCEDVLRNADAAMYAAKTHGKNQFRVFRPSMHLAARRRLELKVELQRAVDRDEFLVYYQPIVELGTGRIRGLEALLRWDHPRMGIVAPSEFMPIAEESGLIVPIGGQVLREATRWLQQMNGMAGPLTLSVNLSPRQLVEPDILESIESALEDSALEPERLVVDVTESVLTTEAEVVIPLLTELRSRGVQVAVDDFGTGYSSLSYLRRLPIDLLKIDRAFVSGVTDAVEDAVVAEAVVKLAGALGFATVAEGIETPEQARELQALGSTFGQGFLYAPPLASADVQGVLEEQA